VGRDSSGAVLVLDRSRPVPTGTPKGEIILEI